MKKKYYIFELDIVTLNILSIVLLVGTGFLGFLLVGKEMFKALLSSYLLIALVGYLVLHEILHSIGYVVNGAKFKNICYGAAFEKGVLFCSCRQKISKRNILWSLIYPLLFIGIITFIVGVIINNGMLVLLSVFNITGAIGDIIMFLSFLQIKEFEYKEFSDPTGFALYSSEDLSKRKFIGIKFKEIKDELNAKVDKKVEISKLSAIIFIILIIVTIINRLFVTWDI